MSAPGRLMCEIRCSADHGGRQRVCGALWGTVYATASGMQIETGMGGVLKGSGLLEDKAALGRRVPPLAVSRLSRPLGRGGDRLDLAGPCGATFVTDEEVLAHLRRHRIGRAKPLMVPPERLHVR